MPLKLVTQANLTDCGLACVAIVAGKSLDAVLRVAIKECGYPKDGPHTTSDENLFKLLDHFGIKYGKKQKVRTVEALPPVAILETRKMPSTGNSHLVVFERAADGDERALDPGWWLKQQVRRDWNRIKLDTFIPILLGNESASKKGSKATKTPAAEVAAVETQPEVLVASKSKKASKPKKQPAKTAAKKVTPATDDRPANAEAVAEPPSNGPATGLAEEWGENVAASEIGETAIAAATSEEGSNDAA